MALRFMLLGSSRVKSSANPKIGLWGSVKPNIWRNPSSCSCLQRNGSSIPGPVGGGIKTQDDTVMLGGTSIYNGAQKDEWIISLAKFAVNQLNVNQNVHLQFVRVVGASHTGVSSLLYHITLVATDASKHKIFHIVVWLQLWRNLMELLVWKPVNDALSVVGVKRGDLKLHEAVMFYMNQLKRDVPRI